MITLLPAYQNLENDDRYTIVSGGRGSGKSTHVAAFIVMLTFQPNEVILFTRYTMSSAKDSIIPAVIAAAEMMECAESLYVSKDRIINRLTGSKVIFSGIKTSSGNQTAKLKGIEGLTVWVLDEAEEMVDKSEFHTIDDSIRTKGGANKVLLVTNSNKLDPDHWIYKEFFLSDRPNTSYIHTTYLDNIDNLDRSFIDTAEYYLQTDPDYYRINYLGEFPKQVNRVFERGYETFHVEPTDFDWEAVGGDFGFADNPTAAVRIWKDGRNLYLKELIYSPGLLNSQIADLIKESGADQLISVWDSAEPKSIAELRRSGVNAYPARKGPGSIRAGLKKLQNFNIFIHSDSENLQSEWTKYRWAIKANGDFVRSKGDKVPVKSSDHGIDAVRYAVTKFQSWD